MSPIPTPAIGDVINVATSAAVEVAAPSGGPVNVQNVVDTGVGVGLDAAQKAIPPEKLQEMAIDLAKARFNEMITFTIDYIRNVFHTNPFMAFLIAFSILILWFVFWRFIGRQAASYAWRVHRRRKYVHYLDEVVNEWNADPANDKGSKKGKESKKDRSARRARALRPEVEALFSPISKPDISRDQDLRESLLKKYGNIEHPNEGWGLLAAAKSFLYYSTVIWWIWKLYETRAKDKRRMKTVSEPQNDVESTT